eukprot:57296_1
MLSRGQFGGVVGFIGFCGLFVTLVIDDLSGYSYHIDEQGNTQEKCHWNKICLNSDFTVEYCFKYSECEHYIVGMTCNDTRVAGQIYLAFTICGLFCSFIATVGCFVPALNKISKFIGVIYLLSCMCCIIAASYWIYEGPRGNTRCYDRRIGESYLGASIILLWICMVIFLFAAILTCGKAPVPDDGRPLIPSTIVYTQTQNIGYDTAK